MTNNNQKYEICDAHCHIFPETIAVKAAEKSAFRIIWCAPLQRRRTRWNL